VADPDTTSVSGCSSVKLMWPFAAAIFLLPSTCLSSINLDCCQMCHIATQQRQRCGEVHIEDFNSFATAQTALVALQSS